MEKLKIFKESVIFFKKHNFEIFDFEDINEFYLKFEKEIEHRFREKIENFRDEDIKILVFQYLGFDTSYGFRYNCNIPASKKIWTFNPYVEDEYTNQFQFINSHIERVLGNQIPISNINYQEKEHKSIVHFCYKNIEVRVEEENLTLLSHDYIFKVKELVCQDDEVKNLYILDAGDYDAVLFLCEKEVLIKLILFLDIDKNRIQ